jgi:photosystem II stability/assembly factor-like uncharacterized protein
MGRVQQLQKVPPRGFVLKWNGSTWTRFDHSEPDCFTGVHFVDENNGWLFASEHMNRIYKTTDGGRTLQFVPDYFRQLAVQTPAAANTVAPSQ